MTTRLSTIIASQCYPAARLIKRKYLDEEFDFAEATRALVAIGFSEDDADFYIGDVR